METKVMNDLMVEIMIAYSRVKSEGQNVDMKQFVHDYITMRRLLSKEVQS